MKNLLKSFTLICLILVMVIFLGCAATQVNSGAGKSVPPAPSPLMPGAPSISSSETSMSQELRVTSSSYGSDANGTTWGSIETADRKIVMTGAITLEVTDISKALEAISSLASQYNGYVVSSSQHADDKAPGGYISIRVPAGKFNDALRQVRSLAVKVLNENSNSQDVTEQYTDLQAQLHNLEATEAQYLDLMKKAVTIKDILDVQRELSNVRGNIERVKGRIQYLERTSDMSLINITLMKSKPIGESSWDVTGIFKSAVDGLIILGKILVGLLIWVLVFSPLWIIIIIIILIIRRKKAKAKIQK